MGQQLSKPEHVFGLCGPIATALNDSRPSPQLAKAAGATALFLLPGGAVVISAGCENGNCSACWSRGRGIALLVV